MQRYNHEIAIVLTVAVVVKIIILVLEASEKRRILLPEYQSYPPEATSGILSRFFFWWQIPLFRTGFSKALSVDDLFKLDKHLASEFLQDLMQTAWTKGSIVYAISYIHPFPKRRLSDSYASSSH